MQYVITEHFKKQIKIYLKKYRSLFRDTLEALKQFDPNNSISLGHRTYKIRVKSSDLKRGKSHGFRLIIFILEIDEMITPLVIYFKGDQADITKKKILYHTAFVEQELNQLT